MEARASHLRVVLDQLCLLHGLDIPLTAIGLLGDRDADQLGRLVLGVGHGVGLSPRRTRICGWRLRARRQLVVCATESSDVLVLYKATFGKCPRELPKVSRWGICGRTPPYQVPRYLGASQ